MNAAAPVWTRVFRVRPLLGGRTFGFDLPFTIRLDIAVAMIAFTAAWWLGLYLAPIPASVPAALMAMVVLGGPMAAYTVLKRPRADGRDRIDHARQRSHATAITLGRVSMDAYARRGSDRRRHRLDIVAGPATGDLT